MGSNEFQKEYIEYLQERNTELLNKLNQMKEYYENKIFSKDMNKQLGSIFADLLNVCTVFPQEIDLFFDKMTGAMSMLQTILLRKSEMVRVVEKISKFMNPSDIFNADLLTPGLPGSMKEENEESQCSKEAETFVSPKVRSDTTSTDPRICSNRFYRNLISGNRNEPHQLSPIIEASPDMQAGNFMEVTTRVPLERLNINKDSPKSRFKGPKTWKKSLLSNKLQSDAQNTISSENNQNLSNKPVIGEIESQKKGRDVDPLEGPSWLYNESTESNSSSSGHITDYRRRKHRFATVFDRNEDVRETKKSEEQKKESPQQQTMDLNESPKTTAHESELMECSKKTSDTAEDLIGESFNECQDNSSSFQNQSCSNTGNSAEESVDENGFAEFEADLNKEGSTPYGKTKEKEIHSNSICKEHKNENSPPCKREKSTRKTFSKSIFDSVSMELTSENTPTTSEPYEPLTSVKHKESKSKSQMDEKDASTRQVEVSSELRNSRVKKEEEKAARTRSSRRGRRSHRGKSKSASPKVFPLESEGRKKRKAAPVNLTEPKLSTKLRRG